MKLAIVNDNLIVSIGNSLELFPNTSFPVETIDIDFLNQQSAMIVKEYKPYTDLQKLEVTEPYIENGYVYTVHVVDKTVEDFNKEQELIQLNTVVSVREQRNRMLTASDWTQIADATVDKQAWLIYRQALRDITSQESFPFDIIWPGTPTA
jgi:hypothetical protein